MAEKLYQERLNKQMTPQSDVDKLKLLHELEVHQIELELQNNELLNAYRELDTANKNYKELFDFTPACYYTLSKEGEILDLNLSGANILGKQPFELKKGRFGFFVSNETKPIFNLFLINIYNTKLKQSCEVTLLIENHSPTHVYIIGQATDDGKACNINMIDITERRKTEDELKTILTDLTIANNKIELQKVEIEQRAKELLITNKELEQSLNLNSDKNLFISILAHDLKSPFSVLLGLSELLKENITQIDLKEIQSIAKEINQSAQNTFVLLEDLLKWAMIQSGKLPFEPKKMNFEEISNEVIQILRPYAVSKNINVINSISDELYVYADRYMLKAVFRNIVSNAIKFTKLNGTVKISALQSESDLKILIEDNGVGIESDRLSNLFDISHFQSTAGTAKENGTGLGLLVCKEFVEKHGGKIWVESEIGKGSKFYFNMPFNVIKDKNPDSDKNEGNIEKGLKILIVDDQYSLRLILSEMIRKFSREIIFASSGEEAVETCQNNPDLDLILLDFQMPGMNGYETVKEIRLFNEQVIIMLQSAFEYTSITEKLEGISNYDYFAKPYNKLVLKQLIEKHFKKIPDG